MVSKQKQESYNQWAASAIRPELWVARVSRSYGLGGELVLKLGDNFPMDRSSDDPLWVEIDSLSVPLFVSAFSMQGTSKAVVVFDDFESEELAARLLGLKIYSIQALTQGDSDDESEDDDWSFLIDFTMTDTTSGQTGIVVDYIDSAMNPLLVVEIEGEQHYIPIAEELVAKVSQRRKTIKLNLPQGILDLNNLVAVEDAE